MLYFHHILLASYLPYSHPSHFPLVSLVLHSLTLTLCFIYFHDVCVTL